MPSDGVSRNCLSTLSIRSRFIAVSPCDAYKNDDCEIESN